MKPHHAYADRAYASPAWVCRRCESAWVMGVRTVAQLMGISNFALEISNLRLSSRDDLPSDFSDSGDPDPAYLYSRSDVERRRRRGTGPGEDHLQGKSPRWHARRCQALSRRQRQGP